MHAACSMPATSPVPHSLPLSHSAKHAKHAHRIHRPSKWSRHHLPPTVSLSGATPRCQQPMAMASGAPPAPLPVVGQQFCAPYVVPLTVTKKSLSLSDGDFAITDANGAVVLKVKGAIFIIQSRRTILDGAGMPLLTMQEKALVVMNCTDVELSQFSSKDSPQIHIGLSMSGKVNVTQLTITAPENSPNTDGVHVDRSEDVHITGSTIGTGDYCISIGPGSRFVTVDGIVCGPGHGVRCTCLYLSLILAKLHAPALRLLRLHIRQPPPPPPRDRRLLPAALPRQGGRPRLSDLPRGARVVHRLSGSSASGSAARSSSGAAPPPNSIVWSVSKDVTKYASLLAAVGKPTFTVYLGYLVNATLTGVYHANVTLHLYLRRMPPTKPPPATAPADLIVPMAPINLGCQRTFANFIKIPVKPTTCSICVRIDVKFPVNPSGDRLHFILMDRIGAKIEAIVAGNDLVHKFDLTLHIGRKYIIYGVTIRPNFEELECRFINHTYECSFSARTFVESLSLEFPRYPKHLMSIHEVMRCPNKTFVDIVGIVVQYDDHQLIGRHPSAELYREVTFRDIWGKLIVVGISGGNLIQNSYRWSTTEGNKSIVLATMLRKNRKYDNRCIFLILTIGNLETSSYTTLAFNPDHPSARALDDIRQKIIGGLIDMEFVQKFIEKRWDLLASGLSTNDPRHKMYTKKVRPM
ncbi:hypothetical protein ZWY2020_023158 [Hordeum vulgare]|nr:hypothetical protein ZWY2020_023158 [Hordeum vulgare]